MQNGLFLFQMDQPALKGIDGGLGPVTGAHFTEHTAHMNAHRLLCDVEVLRNVAVTLSARNAA